MQLPQQICGERVDKDPVSTVIFIHCFGLNVHALAPGDGAREGLPDVNSKSLTEVTFVQKLAKIGR